MLQNDDLLNNHYEVCLVWNSRSGRKERAVFDVEVIGYIPDMPGGIVVNVCGFLHSGRESQIEKLSAPLQEEISFLVGQEIEIHRGSIDVGANYIYHPLTSKHRTCLHKGIANSQ